MVLGVAGGLGVNALLLSSVWRRNRLLVLCYHGTSIDDEHLWNDFLYVPPDWLRRRMELVRESRCKVLPLGEALQRLANGTLPARAVAITYDDGTHDFYRRAYPVLKPFGWPVTVYLTTYYCGFNRPVFDVMCDYLLWKAPLEILDWPKLLSAPIILNEGGRAQAGLAMRGVANRQKMSGQQKDDLLIELAGKLHVDYASILSQRILHIMTPNEVREMIDNGVDVQLHTHRHRVSNLRNLFLREIEDNRKELNTLGVPAASHFCYPGGFYLPEFPGWLKEAGVRSATTCQVDLISRSSDPYLLPRLVDHMNLSETEFRSWLSGLAGMLPQRPTPPDPGQLMEDQPQ
jgi:peptidoglycan/xylan/chitin deacetylase (PgdA/CDA1 family)